MNRDREVCSDAYELAMATGMRVGELCSRAWVDVDSERGLIRVDDQPALGVPESKCMRRVGQVKYDTLAVYTLMIEELLQEAPGAALSRYLPGREREEPVLLRGVALFMDGQPLPEKPRKGYV